MDENRRDDRAPVLDQALLAHIHELNLDYLELLVAEYQAAQRSIATARALASSQENRRTLRPCKPPTDGLSQSQHLALKQVAALAALSARSLRLLAAVPYTLYSLGFEDGKFWDSMSATTDGATPETVAHRYASASDTSMQYAFCKLALVNAWHVASTNWMAARVLYAMPQVTARRLATTPLWQIRCIAASHAVLMMPRWPTNPAFWPDLIRFAAANDTGRFQTTRLLGIQLIAAELEVACAMSRRDPRIAPTVASPRLRARKLQMEPRVVGAASRLLSNDTSK
jgi:hypothetical protein